MSPEEKAREQIDALLTAAGWSVQNYKQYAPGASRGIALREVPLASGECDYLLLVDRQPVGVIEALDLIVPRHSPRAAVLPDAKGASQTPRQWDNCHCSIYSLWRRVLESAAARQPRRRRARRASTAKQYFDGFLVGLTATRAKQPSGAIWTGRQACPKGEHNSARQFRTSPQLRIAVTVDMIATATDIKPLKVLLFLLDVRRRVYSFD